jgi:VanZ family protein
VGKDTRNHLLLYLNLGYALLIVYASLYPLAGWRDSGVEALAFVGAAWPRYYTSFDLASNVFAYLPFGFLCAATLRIRLAPLAACLLATALGASLSLGLELVQNYLPNRVPSNLDLGLQHAGRPARRRWPARCWGRLHPQRTPPRHLAAATFMTRATAPTSACC